MAGRAEDIMLCDQLIRLFLCVTGVESVNFSFAVYVFA